QRRQPRGADPRSRGRLRRADHRSPSTRSTRRARAPGHRRGRAVIGDDAAKAVPAPQGDAGDAVPDERGTGEITTAAALAAVADPRGRAGDVLLASHRRPDGDGTGSMAALALLARARGKRATIYAPDLIPRRYKWLPGAKTAAQRLPSDARFDATIVVDCA